MYNVGDVVTVIDDLYEVEDESEVGVDPDMCKYEGKTLTIQNVSEYNGRTSYRVEENEFLWENIFFVGAVSRAPQDNWKAEEAPHNTMDAEEREKLLKDMSNLLNKYGWKKHTPEALYKIIDKWYDQKFELIEMFKKHPKYVKGKYMIAFDETYERVTSLSPLQHFWSWVYDNSYGTGKRSKAEKLYYIFKEYTGQLLTENVYTQIMDVLPDIKISVGQKTSRAVNKICKELGVNKEPKYNAEYAKYSDALNPIKYVRHTAISVHPIDFLLMSNGNSWCSCHTIDKLNIFQHSQSGCYANGTMSYMLDRVSMIYYTVSQDYEGEELELEPKINRQVFCYAEDKLLQSRMYPQADLSDSYYTQSREIVEKVIADCLEVPNYWTKIKSLEGWIRSRGQHYRDYNAGFKFNFVKLKDSKNTKGFHIGHKGICVVCGKVNTREDTLSCCINIKDMSKVNCPHCGALINEHELYEEGGCYHCMDTNMFKHNAPRVFTSDRTIKIDGCLMSEAEVAIGLEVGELSKCNHCGAVHFPSKVANGALCIDCFIKKFVEQKYTLDTKKNTFTKGAIVAIKKEIFDVLLPDTPCVFNGEYAVGLLLDVDTDPWSSGFELFIPYGEKGNRKFIKNYAKSFVIVLGQME